jgi:nitroimidazol reductase NimA-like FMN-containing flavoprotein (pyridoxamine 5'-phosphate oxidase superfamily)
MTEASANRSHVTRQDRAIYEEGWIKDFLHRAPMAVIATVCENQPFQSTLLFLYDEEQQAVYFHTARRGRVWENLQENPRVCLTASQMGRLLPAKQALNFSMEYQSVVVFGNAHLLDNTKEEIEEAYQALQKLLDKYFPHLHPGENYRATTEDELRATAVFKIAIEEWSGKQKVVADDFPGAFWFGNPPED